MELLLFYIWTIITSFCIEISRELKLYKDLSDVGYKIDTIKYYELKKRLGANLIKKELLLFLIPIYNVLNMFEKTITYNNNRKIIIDQLNILGVLEELSTIEKQEYEKNPTALNALVVKLRFEQRMLNSKSIVIINGNEFSEVYFEINDKCDDITILKITGYLSKLPVEIQKKKVIMAWNKMVKTLKLQEALINIENKVNRSIDINNRSIKIKNETIFEVNRHNDNQEQMVEDSNNDLNNRESKEQNNQFDKGPILRRKKK